MFGLLVGQKNQFEDVKLSSMNLWWAFYTIYLYTLNTCAINLKDNEQIFVV